MTDPDESVTWAPGNIILERLRGEKTVRHGSCPSHDYGQNWILLKRDPDQAVWYRGGEQLVDGSPERTDVHRSVQAEQRLFDYWIDHRLALHANPGGPLHLPAPRRILAQPRLFCRSLGCAHSPGTLNNRETKKAT